MTQRIMAVYRPRADEIALFAEQRGHTATTTLSIGDALALRGALDTALFHAACRDDPLAAVRGGCRPAASAQPLLDNMRRGGAL